MLRVSERNSLHRVFYESGFDQAMKTVRGVTGPKELGDGRCVAHLSSHPQKIDRGGQSGRMLRCEPLLDVLRYR